MQYLKKNIKWLFISFLFLTILLGWSFRLIQKNYQEKLGQINNLTEKVNGLVSSINDSKEAIDEFIAQPKFSDIFIQSGEHKLLDRFYEDLDKSRDVFDELNAIKRFEHSQKGIDTLRLILNDYENSFRELTLSYRERGNNKLGIQGKIRSLSWEICDTVSWTTLELMLKNAEH